MKLLLKRRQFLLATSGGSALMAGVLPACGDGENTELEGSGGSGVLGGSGTAGNTTSAAGQSAAGEAGTPGSASGGASSSGGVQGTAGAGGLAPTCGRITAPNIEGPFFEPDSPERSDLRESGTAGTLLRISGRVYSADCSPLAGALLDFWQADENGAYDSAGYIYRGHQYSDADGRYALDTIVPGRYLNGSTYRPAHVHVKAAGAGTMLLTTQLYFPDDPYNAGDAFIVPSLIMSVEQQPSGLLLAGFDFVLPAG